MTETIQALMNETEIELVEQGEEVIIYLKNGHLVRIKKEK